MRAIEKKIYPLLFTFVWCIKASLTLTLRIMSKKVFFQFMDCLHSFVPRFTGTNIANYFARAAQCVVCGAGRSRLKEVVGFCCLELNGKCKYLFLLCCVKAGAHSEFHRMEELCTHKITQK